MFRKDKPGRILQRMVKNRKITGVVNDVNGEPIIGVTIKEKGTTNGTVSDINAKFTLEVSPGAVLEISYIGYQTQEVKCGRPELFIR